MKIKIEIVWTVSENRSYEAYDRSIHWSQKLPRRNSERVHAPLRGARSSHPEAEAWQSVCASEGRTVTLASVYAAYGACFKVTVLTTPTRVPRLLSLLAPIYIHPLHVQQPLPTATRRVAFSSPSMAARRVSITRSSSSDSSALSNINVRTKIGDPAMVISDNISHVSTSTPPTSLGDSGSLGSNRSNTLFSGDALGLLEHGRNAETRPVKPHRNRTSNVSTYNLKKLSDAQHSFKEQNDTKIQATDDSRSVSRSVGRSLVAHIVEEHVEEESKMNITPTARRLRGMTKGDITLPTGTSAPRRSSRAGVQRPISLKDRLQEAASKAASVLGKRSRTAMEAGKRTLGMASKPSSEGEKQKKLLRELDTGPRGLLDELDLDAEFPAPRPSKKAKVVAQIPVKDPAPILILPNAESAGKRMKKWQREGLYVGQRVGFEPGQRRRLQKSQLASSNGEMNGLSSSKPAFLPLPMFNYLDTQRDFVIPFDVFAPTLKRGDERPKDWTQVNRNRLVGEAKELWEKSERLPVSMCVCPPPDADELGCDDACLNYVMQYECNEDNCGLSAVECGNRPFAELAKRTKKGGSFDIGVEVLKTPNRGFGVRSCRTFAPGQIIMEYTGEIISEGECQRRMRELYMNKQSYYLMELERGLIIDGTKGSMARFINHSCEPNCEVRMVKVNGTPRMGVFAGERGIATGEELTYDYNFDNFSAVRQKCYCGASTCRGFLSKRLNATEQKKLAKEENEKKRKAAEEAIRHAEIEERKKKTQTDRGASWRGWVAVDDPETKEQLKREKREREEAEKNSVRAQRLAARRSGPTLSTAVPVAKRPAKRRKTATEVGATPGVAAQEPRTIAYSHAEQDTASPRSTTNAVGTTFHGGLLASRVSREVLSSSAADEISEGIPPTIVDAARLKTEGDHFGGTRLKQTRSSILLDVKDGIKSLGTNAKNSLSGVASSIVSGVDMPKMKQSTLSFTKKS
nr:histone-lysine n-methyltransferase ash1l [Quercus suber]